MFEKEEIFCFTFAIDVNVVIVSSNAEKRGVPHFALPMVTPAVVHGNLPCTTAGSPIVNEGG